MQKATGEQGEREEEIPGDQVKKAIGDLDIYPLKSNKCALQDANQAQWPHLSWMDGTSRLRALEK